MEQSPKYYIVEASALPEIFQKVAEAKRMLETGETDKVNVAAQAVGISRSAFYKYKDFVFKYSAGNVSTINLSAVLSDRAGVFSALTAALYKCGANIITLNQGLPENGTAAAALTVSLSAAEISPEELLERLSRVDGVISIKRIDGGKQ